LIPVESDSLPHAHAQTTKTYYKHQDSRIKRLLKSFQEDAKYEHVGQDTRSHDGKDDQGKYLEISKQNTKSKDNDKGSRSKITKEDCWPQDNESNLKAWNLSETKRRGRYDVGIFDDAYDDRDKGAEVDCNNLETIYLLEKESLEPNGSIETREIKKGLMSEIKPGWLFLAYASFMDFIVYQMDVKSAFLYGTIEEEVYVNQPLGFVDPEFPDRVYKVKKALYGLHQALRAWYETLYTYLLDNGFRRGTIDKTLFIKKIKDDILLVQVYADDIIFGSTKRFKLKSCAASIIVVGIRNFKMEFENAFDGIADSN
nr:putative ribonuclease H-like domain-containing protein [Tanacetum cinerariifolium]